jgi:pantothenate kinase type III
MSEDWLFDLGNTRLKFALLRNDIMADVQALPHSTSTWHERLPHGDTAYLASVAAPELRVELLDALSQRFRRIVIAHTARSFGGLHIAYADPSKLGADRFLAMLGARRVVEGAVLVVGVGTALTIDLVDATGQHRGGRIAPSPTLMRESLHQRGRSCRKPAAITSNSPPVPKRRSRRAAKARPWRSSSVARRMRPNCWASHRRWCCMVAAAMPCARISLGPGPNPRWCCAASQHGRARCAQHRLQPPHRIHACSCAHCLSSWSSSTSASPRGGPCARQCRHRRSWTCRRAYRSCSC